MAETGINRPVVDLDNLTIGEALEVTNFVKENKNYTNPIKKNILDAGLSLDEPFSSFSDKKTLESISLNDFVVEGKSKLARKDPYKYLTTIHNSIEEFSFDTNQEWKQPDYGDMAVKRFKIVTGKQIRNSKVFKAYPKAEILLPKLTEALQSIEDVEARDALIFNSLVPMRPGEVAKMEAGDIDLKTGEISILIRGNKTRANIFIPDMALEILKERAKGKKEGDLLFNTTTNKMTTALKNSGFIESMNEYKSIMGRSITGAADVRKLVPAIIAYELGYPDEISEIMGHENFADIDSSIKKMTKDFYIGSGRMFGKDFEFSTTTALKGLQNKWAEVLNLNYVNDLATELNVNIPDYIEKDLRTPVVFEGDDLIEGTKPVQKTAEDVARIEEKRAQRNKENAAFSELKVTEAELKTAQTKVETAKTFIEGKDTLIEGAKAKAEIDEATSDARKNLKTQKELDALIDDDIPDSELNDIDQVFEEKLNKRNIIRGLAIAGATALQEVAGRVATPLEIREAQKLSLQMNDLLRQRRGVDPNSPEYDALTKQIEEAQSALTTANVDILTLGTRPVFEAMGKGEQMVSQSILGLPPKSEKPSNDMDEQMNNLIPQP